MRGKHGEKEMGASGKKAMLSCRHQVDSFHVVDVVVLLSFVVAILSQAPSRLGVVPFVSWFHNLTAAVGGEVLSHGHRPTPSRPFFFFRSSFSCVV